MFSPSLSPRLAPFFVTAIIVIAEIAISFNAALMPHIQSQFQISPLLAQMTIGVGLFSLGLAGLVYGGVADSLGRRPVFLFSMIFFSITALLCAAAPNIELFLLARLLQGIGSGAGWVVGNACLHDVFQGKSYVRVMNYVHGVAGIAPALAPLAGSYLGVAIGWRPTLFIVFVLAALCTVGIFFFQPETLRHRAPLRLNSLWQGYTTLWNRAYMRYMVIKVLTVMLLYVEVSNMPLIYVNHMGVLPQHYGLLMCPVLVLYTLATLISARLASRIAMDRLLSIGLILLMVSNALLLGAAMIAPLTPVLIQSLKSLTYIGWGFIFGNATAEIVSAAPGRAAAASAMMIALEMLFSTLGIGLLGLFFNGTVIPLSALMCSVAIFCLAFLQWGRR